MKRYVRCLLLKREITIAIWHRFALDDSTTAKSLNADWLWHSLDGGLKVLIQHMVLFIVKTAVRLVICWRNGQQQFDNRLQYSINCRWQGLVTKSKDQLAL